MSLYELLLVIHVLAAFAAVAATTMFWTLIAAAWRLQRPSEILALGRVAAPANVLVIGGMFIALLFGIALAIERDEYQLWDAWILASIALWAISTETGRRGGSKHAREAEVLNRLVSEGRDEPGPELRAAVPDRGALVLDAVSTVALLAVLVLMIFKPGV